MGSVRRWTVTPPESTGAADEHAESRALGRANALMTDFSTPRCGGTSMAVYDRKTVLEAPERLPKAGWRKALDADGQPRERSPSSLPTRSTAWSEPRATR